MQFDADYGLVRPLGLRYHAKAFFYCLFVKLTPWWDDFQQCRRVRREFLKKMGVTEAEMREHRQLLRRTT